MDIQQLKVFLTVSKTCNFTKASEELFISRQAVSQTIHQLENQIGSPLFIVKKNTLSMTPLGEIFKTEAQKIVHNFNSFESAMKKYASNQTNHLEIVMGAGIMLHLTPEIFVNFSSQFNNILLSTWETNNRKMINQVLNGEAQIGLIGSMPAYLNAFETSLIRKSDLYILVNRKNPLSVKEFLTIEDLKGQPIVGHGPEYDLHQFFVAKCQEAGFQPTFSMISTDASLALSLVRQNRSLSFGFYEPNQERQEKEPSIKLIPLKFNTPDEWGIYAITPIHRKRSIPVQIFIHYLQQN